MIIQDIKDDLDLAEEVIRISEGSQRLPVSWTLRLAIKCLQQAERIKELEENNQNTKKRLWWLNPTTNPTPILVILTGLFLHKAPDLTTNLIINMTTFLDQELVGERGDQMIICPKCNLEFQKEGKLIFLTPLHN